MKTATGQSDKLNQRRATLAQILYLGNLLILPGILFLALIVMYFRYAHNNPHALAGAHIRLAVGASLLAMLLLGGGAGLFWLIGYYGAGGWATVILYALIVHTSFVMLGIIGLARAISGKTLVTH